MSKEKKRKKREKAVYPKRSLLDSLEIAKAIKEYSAGNPYDRLDLARSSDNLPSSRLFRELITSSSQFGLTEGSYLANKISLTPLGRSIVYPIDPKERANGLKKALFGIPFYEQFFMDYDNHKLPDLDFLEGTLNRNYEIPVNDCNKCYELIVTNATQLQILENFEGAQYIHLNKLGTKNPATNKPVIPKVNTKTPDPITIPAVNVPVTSREGINMTVNINLELPTTENSDVYDKIFKSLKKNILSPYSKTD